MAIVRKQALLNVTNLEFYESGFLGSSATLKTGTVSVSASSAAVTGSGTLFISELTVGDILLINGITREVSVITDNTHLTLRTVHPTGASALTYSVMPLVFFAVEENSQAVVQGVLHARNTVNLGTASVGEGALTIYNATNANTITLQSLLAAPSGNRQIFLPDAGGTIALIDTAVIFPTTIELGHASANTLSASSGVLSIEGKTVLDQTNTLTGISNKTFVAPVLGVATGTSLTLSAATPLTLGDGSGATAILASNLSGATDPTITFGNAAITVSHQLLVADGTAAAPGIARSADSDDGIVLGDTTVFYRDGIYRVGISGSGTESILTINTANAASPSAAQLINLVGEATPALAQRSGATAQTWRIYNTYTSSTNYERGKLEWASNVLNVGTEKGSGGGTARAMALQTDGTTAITINTDQTVAQVAKTTTYANVATAGWGLPAIYAAGGVSAKTNLTSGTLATYTCGAADGSFEVSANVNVTTSTTHTFSVDVSYTDETNAARVLILPMTQLAGTVITGGLITNVTGTGPYHSPAVHIRCKAATAITIATSAGGTYTAVVYNAEGIIRQIR